MRYRLVLVMMLVVCLGAGSSVSFVKDADAGRRGFSSRSFSSRSFSKSTSSLWGKRSGGGFFGSSSKKSTSGSSSSKSSSGYSKPGSTSGSSSKSTSSGYSKPGSTKGTSKSASGYSKSSSGSSSGFSGKSSFDSKVSTKNTKLKSKQSLGAYKSRTSSFSKKTASTGTNYDKSGIYKNAKTKRNYGYDDYYRNRDSYYGGMGWNAPGWAYRSYSSFGMWDAFFWWMVLDNVTRPNYAMAAYHHGSDPGFQQWKQEAEKLAQDNAELKTKLDNLDKQVAGFSGPRNPDYLPEGVPAEVALSAEAMAAKSQEEPILLFATASKTGNYQAFAEMIREAAPGLDIRTVNTAGSMENLRLLMAGKVDAAMVQSDAFDIYRRQFPGKELFSEQAAIYPELVQMIANRDSGIDDVGDIRDGHVLYIGPKGSGTALTWEGFCLLDDKYRRIRTEHLPYNEALERVSKDTNAVMMYVSGLRSGLLEKADKMTAKSDSLKMIAVNDWDFNDARDMDGNRIYTFTEIPGAIYPHLQRGMLWGTKKVETLAVNAVLVVRSEWVDKNGPEAMDLFSFGVLQAKPQITRRVGGR